MYCDTNSMWETEAQKVNVATHQYFDHPFSTEALEHYPTLALQMLITAVKVGKEISTNPRNGFSQLYCLAEAAAVTSLPRGEAQRPRMSFCHTEAFSTAHSHSLIRWSFSVRQYTLAPSLSSSFSGQIHHFGVFLHYRSRTDLMTRN